MKQKSYAVFLDVDGTLCNDLGKIPSSAIYAIKKARANGHKVFLCTGRCMAELYDSILSIGFDGIIGSSGGYILYNGEIIEHRTFPESALKDILSYFQKHRVGFYAECNHGIYMDSFYRKWLQNYILQKKKENEDIYAFQEFLNSVYPFTSNTKLYDVNKISFMNCENAIDPLLVQIGADFCVVRNTIPFLRGSGELTLRGVHKASAIQKLENYAGLCHENTLAVGDGWNDLEMLTYAAVGIAMGNADEKLKRAADEVTSTHNEDGIYKAFQRHGLI